MTRQIINTGSSANDGTGDTLRIAGNKMNDNFRELYLILGDSAGTAQAIIHTESGIDFIGSSARTKLGFVQAAAQVDVLLPDSNGTILTNNSTATLINKSISTDSNSITGIAASSFVLSNSSGIVDGSVAAKAIPSGVVVGTTDTQTLTNKTLTSPILTTPSISQINDANTSPIIKFDATGSAVRELTVNNADSSGFVGLTASGLGGDLNVSMNLRSKGSGAVRSDKFAYEPVTVTADGTVNSNQTYTVCNKGSTLALSLSNGTVDGEIKIFTNKGAGTATITPGNFAHGTSFALPQFASAQCIWDGAKWYLTGSQGITVT